MKQQTLEFIEKNNGPLNFPLTPLPNGTLAYQARWVLTCGLPWLEISNFNLPYKEMYTEAATLKDMYVEHRPDSGNGWYSLAVHGISHDKTNIAETYGLQSSTAIYDWTEITDRCPTTVNFFKNILPHNKYQRLRFMLVRSDGYIAPHSDNVNSDLGAINISLNNPDGCYLTTELGTVPFKDHGSMFLFNNHYQHAVYNSSNIDRYHIIVHGWQCPSWFQIIVDNYTRMLNG